MLIDLAAERNRRDGPELVSRDAYGRPLYCYAIAYIHEGRHYSFDLWAYSFDDAEAHVQSLRGNAELSGQIFARGPM